MLLMLLVMMAIAAIGTGSFIDGARARQFKGKIQAGLASSDPLTRQAWAMIKQDIEASPAAKFIDAQVIRLEKTRSYEAIYPDAAVEVYILRYAIQARNPGRVSSFAGVTVENGWLREQRTLGTPYLVARRARGAGGVEYLGTIWPDSGSMLEMVCDLKYRSEAQDGASGAQAGVDVRRIFALTDSQLTPQAAAEQLVGRYLTFIREAPQPLKPLIPGLTFEEYDGTQLAMYPAASAPAEYAVQDWESAGEAWVIEPSLRYRYRDRIEVTLTDPPDPEMLRALYEGKYEREIVQWVTLHQDSGIGFLMIKDGDSYTLRSRYFGLDGQPR